MVRRSPREAAVDEDAAERIENAKVEALAERGGAPADGGVGKPALEQEATAEELLEAAGAGGCGGSTTTAPFAALAVQGR